MKNSNNVHPSSLSTSRTVVLVSRASPNVWRALYLPFTLPLVACPVQSGSRLPERRLPSGVLFVLISSCSSTCDVQYYLLLSLVSYLACCGSSWRKEVNVRIILQCPPRISYISRMSDLGGRPREVIMNQSILSSKRSRT